ncbi:MAG: hypothetical protein HOD43_06120 [Candidatus Marinimicrobia bacterium]|nr:hypothetical protein [Candidatus Neomarinimicrobiota bacterium]MBT4419668.1 hypothetical protein [Candidatus Neomarinimicrobiota bacterium]MBT4994784.1 hypothetical protein [Candidatus Neomarinimicrobiota bacterium]MBT6003911.1 hypothetical protein [Candidatus Neomarinimicrobiota bacterium]
MLFVKTSLAGTPVLHPQFPLLDESGKNVLFSGQPLSTMQTCGTCHDTQFIVSHSRHSDAGLSSMNNFSPSASDYPWDRGSGYYGQWNPLNYRFLSAPDDSLLDLSQGEWVQTLGFRHVGGGPAEYNQAGVRLDKSPVTESWDWQKSGVEEMNCFLCHTKAPDIEERNQALQNGNFRWANSATLIQSGAVIKERTGYRWNPEAFTAKGDVRRDFLSPTDPSNENCGQCHGLVFTAKDTPEGLKSCDWNTATTGEIIAPQRINRSGLNLKDKENLHRSWDIHTERAVQCVDCHPSANNPIYYQDSKKHRLDHLIFDARRIDVMDFLYRPSHEFARGGLPDSNEQRSPGETMRSCDGCHDANVGHNWLPYKDAHFAKVSCESCHIPRMHAPAYQQIDWTVLTKSQTAAHDCRGAEGDPRDVTTIINGFEPILLPSRNADNETRLKPFNMISSWYWVYGDTPRPVRLADLKKAYFKGNNYREDVVAVFDVDGNGEISEAELRIDSPEKEQAIRQNLETVGLTQVKIEGNVEAYKINHAVTGGEWATRECASCHSEDSRIGAPFELATFLPGGIVPGFTGAIDLGQIGTMEVDARTGLSYTMDLSTQGLYVFGETSIVWVDWLGFALMLATIIGVVVHATYRVISARRNGYKEHQTKRIYMYRFYERLWHWVQVMAIFLLLITGFIIHKPEMLGILSFPFMVQVHNALGFILFANAFLAVIYHLVSGEIKQYIPQPRGFFDQAVAQANFYLKGIFRGEEHPFEKSRAKKLNPLQQMTYFGLLNLLLPMQIITGLLIWSIQTWPSISNALGGLRVLGPIHTLLAWLFATFILLHVYLTTTGHKPMDGIKAMINGWDEVEDHSGRKSTGIETESKEKLK